MQTEQAQDLQRLREALPRMQAERDRLPSSSVFLPSKMWTGPGAFLNFVFDLSNENLRNIRLHTGFMTGDPWFAHLGRNQADSDEEKLEYPLIRQYHDLVSDIPRRFWGSEPVTTPQAESVGIRYRGRLVTDDLVRYQRCLSNLYWTGVYRHLDGISAKPLIVEIGAGYGGLAHQIASTLANRCTYVIFDLPEILYWSAAFLIVNNPGKRVYIYNSEDTRSLEDICSTHDFVFLPNFRFDRIAELRKVHLAVNLLSFQEMSDEQIDFYASRLASCLQGALYSENCSKHPLNRELTATVDAHLSRWFDLTPNPAVLRGVYPHAGSFQHPDVLWLTFPYVGTPKGDPTPIRPVDRVFHTRDKRLKLREAVRTQ